MLTSMSPKLHKQYMAMDEYTIISHLRELFDEHARYEKFEVSKLLFRLKMVERTSPIQRVLKMNGYVERLD